MSTPEDRQWNMLFQRLDRLEDKIDKKLSREEFNDFRRDTDNEMRELKSEVDDIKDAAITPDQIVTMIGDGLQKSEARGITGKDRNVRYGLAILSVGTFAILLIQTIRDISGH